MEELAGQLIKGYELLERIGGGGFGAVYRAYQSTIGREVAVKIILPGFANHPDFIRRFKLEAQLIARLEHLHIVPLYDFWREPGNAYLVMRWLRGGSAEDAARRWSIRAAAGRFAARPNRLRSNRRPRQRYHSSRPETV
jgi:serine/threonine protein kinase